MSLTFSLIDYGSAAYKDAVSLREEILRKPLGKRFTPEDIAGEKEHLHIAGYMGGKMVASCMLVLFDNRYKMQRVAVRAEVQGTGVGSAMMEFCEELARKKGIGEIFCHARQTAIPFYHKHQFIAEGEMFPEQGIPHVKMRKTLNRSGAAE